MRKAAIKLNLDLIAVSPGLALRYDGQRYDLTEVGEVLTWASHCRSCGAPFTCHTKMQVNWLTRTCERHRMRTTASLLAPPKNPRGEMEETQA